MPTDAVILKSGRFEDAYDIKEEVGRGQFAVVHRVVRRHDGAEFAAKVMRKRTKAVIDFSGVSKQQVEQEVGILLMVEHPNVIRLEEAYEEKHCFVLVFELLKGGELFSKMLTRGRFSEAETVFYLREILMALKHLHTKSIVHLDIKPENVMLSDDSSVKIKIIDFGLSRILNSKHVTRDMVGTPEFVAPEVINYDEITLSTDMWSVGVLTYILLTGYSPFLGRTQQETYERINEARCQLDGPHFAGVSDVARDFVRRLIRRQPKERANVAQCLQHSWLTLPVPDVAMSDIDNSPDVVVVAQRLEINDSPSSGTSSPALTDRASIVSANSRDASIHTSMNALTSATPPPDEDGKHLQKTSQEVSAPSTPPSATEQNAYRLGTHHHHHHHHQDQGAEQEQSPSSMIAARAARLRPTREPIVLLRPIPEQQSLLISARGNLRSSKPGEATEAANTGSTGVSRKQSAKRSALTEQLKKLKPRSKSPLSAGQTSPASSSSPMESEKHAHPRTKQLSSTITKPEQVEDQNEHVLAVPAAQQTALKINDTSDSGNQPGETVKSTHNVSLRIRNSPRQKTRRQSSSSSQSGLSPGSDTVVGSVGAEQVFEEAETPGNRSRQLRIIQGTSSKDENSETLTKTDKKPPLPSVVEPSGNKKVSQQQQTHHKFFRLLSSGATEESHQKESDGPGSKSYYSDRRRGAGNQLLAPTESDPPIKRSNSPKETFKDRMSRGSPAIFIHTDADSSSDAFESASSAAFESLDNIAQTSQSASRLHKPQNQQLTLTTSSLSHLHLMSSTSTTANSLSPGAASSLSVSPGAGRGRTASTASSSTTLSDRGGGDATSSSSNRTSTSTITAAPSRKHSGSGHKKHGKSSGETGGGAAQKAAEKHQSAQSGDPESSAMRLLRKLSGKHKSKPQQAVNQVHIPAPESNTGDELSDNNNTVILKHEQKRATPPFPTTSNNEKSSLMNVESPKQQQRQSYQHQLSVDIFTSNRSNSFNALSSDRPGEQQAPMTSPTGNSKVVIPARRTSLSPSEISSGPNSPVGAGSRIPTTTVLTPRTPSPRLTAEQQQQFIDEQQQSQNPSLIRWLIGKVITSGK